MNTDLLRTFLEVSKTRHFGQAAENLYLTQSAVSFRIRQLEEVVGTKLFIRQRNNILLTYAGERLLPHAENILASWQLALQDVGFSDDQNIQLALGSTSNLWGTFLQSLLPKMADKFPGLFMRTEIHSSQELVRALISGRIDMGVVLDPPQMVDLNVVKVGHLQLVLTASERGVSAHDIPSVGYIFVDWGMAFNMQHAKLFDQPVAPKLHTSQTHIALEFMLAHGGVAFLPQTIVQSYLESKTLFLVADAESISRDVYVVYGGSSEKMETIEHVVSLLQEFNI